MESRKYFVEQVASTIIENHGETKDSFIFGISGKWGEGKTTFLEDLEKEVKKLDKGFIVLWINPWKFASDKISFLRSFLAKVPAPKLNWFDSIRSFLLNPIELRDLKYDVSKDVIDWRMLLLFGLYLCLSSIVYFYSNQLPLLSSLHVQIPKEVRNIIGISILIPIGLALFKSLSTYQQGSKTISTIDRFDELLTLRLSQNVNSKFLVYIDDLDRVTPIVARDVLDNLRSFFDKRELSFIVAGDHTVLERYIGRELLPGENEIPAQLEEGRRYLKKIFNVYWRLPPPIPTELKKFIEEDLFTPVKKDLDNIFSGTDANSEREKFAYMLARYFDGNFRQIIRFFEMVRFTFQIIEKKRAAVSSQEKPYFDELIKYPLLVIRILLIQENCTPLFEAMLRDVEILLSLEDAVENKDSAKIQVTLNSCKLSPNQRSFIEKFLFEEPRFYKDSSLVVSNLQPFLVFAADSSFGDGRGPTPEKFIQILHTGNPETLKNSILSSGEPRLQEAANNFASAYSQQPVDPQQMTLLSTLVSALREIPTTHNSHAIFAQKIKDIDFQYLNTLSPADRGKSNMLIWGWLDSLEDKSIYPELSVKFPALDISDWEDMKPVTPVGPFTTARILSYFNNFYASNRAQVFGYLIPILDLLDKQTVISETASLIPTIIEDMSQNNQGIRDAAYELMIYTDHQSEVHTRVLEKVKELDQDFWNWINSKISTTPIRTKKLDLEQSLLSRMDTNPEDLGSIWGVMNFANANNFSNASDIWQRLSTININVFFTNIAHFATNQLLQIIPDKSNAKALFSALLDKILAEDEGSQIQLMRWLRRDIWLWKLMDKPKSLKAVETLEKSSNIDLSREATEVLNSWNPKI